MGASFKRQPGLAKVPRQSPQGLHDLAQAGGDAVELLASEGRGVLQYVGSIWGTLPLSSPYGGGRPNLPARLGVIPIYGYGGRCCLVRLVDETAAMGEFGGLGADFRDVRVVFPTARPLFDHAGPPYR